MYFNPQTTNTMIITVATHTTSGMRMDQTLLRVGADTVKKGERGGGGRDERGRKGREGERGGQEGRGGEEGGKIGGREEGGGGRRRERG